MHPLFQLPKALRQYLVYNSNGQSHEITVEILDGLTVIVNKMFENDEQIPETLLNQNWNYLLNLVWRIHSAPFHYQFDVAFSLSHTVCHIRLHLLRFFPILSL